MLPGSVVGAYHTNQHDACIMFMYALKYIDGISSCIRSVVSYHW